MLLLVVLKMEGPRVREFGASQKLECPVDLAQGGPHWTADLWGSGQ